MMVDALVVSQATTKKEMKGEVVQTTSPFTNQFEK